MNACDGCQRIQAAEQGDEPLLIHRFGQSLLFLGDHQYFEGYSVLMLKRHAREIHELEGPVYDGLMQDLRLATRAIARAFQPWKMNHACLGNQVQHVHWHIMPRYELDPCRFQDPWQHAGEFGRHIPDPGRRDALIQRIRASLSKEIA